MLVELIQVVDMSAINFDMTFVELLYFGGNNLNSIKYESNVYK